MRDPCCWCCLAPPGLVLLLACANVASLTAGAHAESRARAVARTALGASRTAADRPAAHGEHAAGRSPAASSGLLVSGATLGALTTFVGRFTSRTRDIAIDGRVLLFTLVVSIVTGLVFGALPALIHAPRAGRGAEAGRREWRRQPAPAPAAAGAGRLAGGSVGGAAHSRRPAAHQLLSSAEGQSRATTPSACCRPRSTATSRATTRRKTPAAVPAAHGTAADACPACSRRRSAAWCRSVRHSGRFLGPFEIEGRSAIGRERPAADVAIASDELLPDTGHSASSAVASSARPIPASRRRVAIISQSMARYWDGDDPVGSRIRFDSETLVHRRRRRRQRAAVRARSRGRGASLRAARADAVFVRRLGAGAHRGDPTGAIAAAVRDAVHALDPDLPVENMKTLEDLRSGFLATPRLTADAAVLFAAPAPWS